MGHEAAVSVGDEGWSVTIAGLDHGREDWAATLLALANGTIGIRGTIEEQADGPASTFLAHAYEQTPIHYHERFAGFAMATDTRVPVAEPLGLTLRIDAVVIDLTDASIERCARTLDLQRGLLRRRTSWRLADGRLLEVEAERLVPLDGGAVVLRRMRVALDGRPVAIEPRLAPAPRGASQSDDPRIGANLAGAGFVREQADGALVERLAGSGIGVAAVQRTQADDEWTVIVTAYAAGMAASAALADEAKALADHYAATGFEAAAMRQRDLLAAFWDRAGLGVAGDDAVDVALRLNLFHVFASAGRDGLSSAAAKGLTGEGYEGHYFWDTEVFMLPLLAVLAPEVARAMLAYRYSTLAAAIANARALNHERGALYAWRTIAGRECSAHYPSGSAQYHINAAIGFGIGFYDEATGDTGFLIEMGAEMLVETARLWLALGAWHGDSFQIHGVTGPDEYTALIDNNWYTNRMAQKHLRLTAHIIERVAATDPVAWAATAARIGFGADEPAAFRAAADAMRLPYDAARDLDAQDDSFLDKPRWDLAGTPAGRFPLLLHHHPMTLYRHQLAKQADLVLGLVLAGETVPLARKRRDFDHYDAVTAHDSTLSACSFSILASEVGRPEKALGFFRDTVLVDLADLHGNTSHGVHMAALAGSWLALVWGFGGFRTVDGAISFAPVLPREWTGYRFGLRWRGSELRVAVAEDRVDYRVVSGPPLAFRHDGKAVTLATGEGWTGPLAAR